MSGDWRLIEEITAQVSASKPYFGAGVADVANDSAHDVAVIQDRRGGDLSGHHRQAGGHQRLAGHAAHGVLGKHGIQDGVGNLVGDLVGMAFGNRFGGEQKTALVLAQTIAPSGILAPGANSRWHAGRNF